jgi:hypothetical protein
LNEEQSATSLCPPVVECAGLSLDDPLTTSELSNSLLYHKAFHEVEYSDPNWDSVGFGKQYQGTNSGYHTHAGYLYMDPTGKRMICGAGSAYANPVMSGGMGSDVKVLERQADNSWTVTTLVDGGVGDVRGYTMSAAGVIAGRSNDKGAIWDNGWSNPPTIDTNITAWKFISRDGTRLYGVTTGGDSIERVIGVGDNIILAGAGIAVSAIDLNGENVIQEGSFVSHYRKIAGVWTPMSDLAPGNTSDPNDYPSVISMTNDGRYCFSADNGNPGEAWVFDLCDAGPIIIGTAMGMPSFYPGLPVGQTAPSAMAGTGAVMFGFISSAYNDPMWYWLREEGYTIAHSLRDYLEGLGMTGVFEPNDYWDGIAGRTNVHITLDAMVMNENGTAFGCRSQKQVEDPPAFFSNQYSVLYMACPSPSSYAPATGGAPITVTIPAGTIVSTISVLDANATALAQAEAEAAALRLATPCGGAAFSSAQQQVVDECPP